jgi:hypothetical protein
MTSSLTGNRAAIDAAFNAGSNAYCRERAAQNTNEPIAPVMLDMQGTERAAWFNGWRYAMQTKRGHAYPLKDKG